MCNDFYFQEHQSQQKQPEENKTKGKNSQPHYISKISSSQCIL